MDDKARLTKDQVSWLIALVWVVVLWLLFLVTLGPA